MTESVVSQKDENVLKSPKQKKRKIMIKTSTIPTKQETTTPTTACPNQEERIVFSKRLLKSHYISLQHSKYEPKEIELSSKGEEEEEIGFVISKIIKENHSSPIERIVFFGNLFFTQCTSQVNLYDNNNFGTHVDLLSHYLLPSHFGNIVKFEFQLTRQDILFVVLTDSGYLILASIVYSSVLHVLQLEGIEKISFLSENSLLLTRANDVKQLNWEKDIENYIFTIQDNVSNSADMEKDERSSSASSPVEFRIENSAQIPFVELINGKDKKVFSTVVDRKLAGKAITSVSINDNLNFVVIGTNDGHLIRFDVK